MQVLVPGITYDHTYWSLPDSAGNDRYSYTDAANRVGMATIALDRIGIGQSSHPPGLAVTVDPNAYVVHQVIQTLRRGDSGLPRFAKVALVGHSYGSWTSWYEADRYHDVDVAIFSGADHGVDLASVPELMLFYPAPWDPQLRGSVSDPTYLTSDPGQRNLLFHAPGWVDPKLLSYDEQYKQTTTVGELYNFPIILTRHLDIGVPAMVVMGADDTLFCGGPVAPNCSTAASVVNYERPYLGAASVDGFVLPGAGHDLNYAPNAGLWFSAAQRWIADHTR